MFLIYCIDRPGCEALRAELRSAHIDYLERNSDLIALIGPTLDPAGKPEGMMLILDVAERHQAEAFLANEPFVVGNLFGSTEIRPWRAAMGRWLRGST
jgi:uncharacterized protein YciI